MVQREVLIEPAQHLCQMLLLFPSSPVSVLKNPIFRVGQELSAALCAGHSDQCKAP